MDDSFTKYMKKFDQDAVNLKRIFIDLVGGKHLDAIVLGQILYRSGLKNGNREKTFEEDGRIWIDMTYKDWYDDCRISRSSMINTTKRLETFGYIITKDKPRGSTKTSYISVMPEEIIKAIKGILRGEEVEKNIKKDDEFVQTGTNGFVQTDTNDLYKLVQRHIYIVYNNIKYNNNELININSYSFSVEKEKERLERLTNDVILVFNHWNKLFKKVKGINSHRSLKSCLSRKIRKWGERSEELWFLIYEILLFVPVELIINSINNYYNIYSSKKYFYNYKFETLPNFLYSDRGLKQFMDDGVFVKYATQESLNPHINLRNRYKPLIFKFDNQNILDKHTQTYMGVSLKVCKNRDIEAYLSELVENSNDGELKLHHFISLEECIATGFWLKDKFSISKLELMINIHAKYRRFIKINYETDIDLYYS